MDTNQEPQGMANSQQAGFTAIILGIIVVLLIVSIGYLGWQLKLYSKRHTDDIAQHTKDLASNQSLQKQIADMKKAAAAATAAASASKSVSTTPVTPAPCVETGTIPVSLQENLSAAISSKNTAALAGYMTNPVTIVYAGSEKNSSETPDQAVSDLDFVNNNAVGPWDFNLPAATINDYKAGFYHQYFDGKIYVGKSSNGYVISFRINACNKVDRIFVSASEDLLMP